MTMFIDLLTEYSRRLLSIMRSRVRLLVLMSFFGCGETSGTVEALTSCNRPISPESNIEPGIGGVRFRSISDGDEVRMIGGFQGGHHLWGAIRLEMAQTTEISALHFLVCQNDLPIAEQRYQDLRGLPQTPHELFGVPIVFTGIPTVTALDGTEAALRYAVKVNDVIQEAQVRVSLKCCGHVTEGF